MTTSSPKTAPGSWPATFRCMVERNDFINAHEADVHIVGAGAVIRSNRINGGASMGIVAENARGAIIDDNELEGLTAYGVMVRGSSNTLVRANRLHNCGYGLAFVLGDARSVSTAIDNTIIEPKFNGIDVIGDSPILRRNQVLRAHAFALHVEDFQPPNGQKVHVATVSGQQQLRQQPGQQSGCHRCSPVQPPVRRSHTDNELRQHSVDSAAGLAESARAPARRHLAADHRRDPGRDRRALVLQRLRAGFWNGELGPAGAGRHSHCIHPAGLPNALARALARLTA